MTAPALSFHENARAHDVGVIMGYARNQRLVETPARIRWVTITKGPDLYHQHNAEREVFALYGAIDSGVSGGPFVATDGTVSGMVYATDLSDSHASFALTARELRSQAHVGTAAVSAVSTRRCAD